MRFSENAAETAVVVKLLKAQAGQNLISTHKDAFSVAHHFKPGMCYVSGFWKGKGTMDYCQGMRKFLLDFLPQSDPVQSAPRAHPVYIMCIMYSSFIMLMIKFTKKTPPIMPICPTQESWGKLMKGADDELGLGQKTWLLAQKRSYPWSNYEPKGVKVMAFKQQKSDFMADFTSLYSVYQQKPWFWKHFKSLIL